MASFFSNRFPSDVWKYIQCFLTPIENQVFIDETLQNLSEMSFISCYDSFLQNGTYEGLQWYANEFKACKNSSDKKLLFQLCVHTLQKGIWELNEDYYHHAFTLWGYPMLYIDSFAEFVSLSKMLEYVFYSLGKTKNTIFIHSTLKHLIPMGSQLFLLLNSLCDGYIDDDMDNSEDEDEDEDFELYMENDVYNVYQVFDWILPEERTPSLYRLAFYRLGRQITNSKELMQILDRYLNQGIDVYRYVSYITDGNMMNEIE